MINDRLIDQAFSDLRSTCGGVREDYFGLLYLEQEHNLSREKALNHVAFGGHDYGVDGFHFDRERRNLYLFQFKYSDAYSQFKSSLQRLITDGVERIFTAPNKDDKEESDPFATASLFDRQPCADRSRFAFASYLLATPPRLTTARSCSNSGTSWKTASTSSTSSLGTERSASSSNSALRAEGLAL